MHHKLTHYKLTPRVNNTQRNCIQSKLYDDVKNSQSFIRLEKRITNKEFIKYAFALFKRDKKDNNRNKKCTINKYMQGLNFDNIKYPLEKEDYEKLERNNNVYLHVHEPNYKNNARYESEITEMEKLVVLFFYNGRYSYVKKFKFIKNCLARNLLSSSSSLSVLSSKSIKFAGFLFFTLYLHCSK